jgi:hypothetical protein
MINKFWKGSFLLPVDARAQQAACMLFDQKAVRKAPYLKIYYRVKKYIPRQTVILLQSIKAFMVNQKTYACVELLYKDALEESLKKSGEPFRYIWFWPEGYKTAVSITHDIEEQRGFDNSLRLAEIDEKFGIKSAFEIVPERYKMDYGVLDELRRHGFEIAIQGLKHDGKLFDSGKVFKERMLKIKEYANKWKAKGFRSPFLLRNVAWMKDMGFEWDSSFADWDPYGPQPGGCCTVFPFFLSPDTVELPVTMIQDHVLFNVLKKKDIAIWKKKFEYIAAINGFVNVVVHPDYIFDGHLINLYSELLEYIKSKQSAWVALPSQICQWWKDRNNSAIEFTNGEPYIEGPARQRGNIEVAYKQVWPDALLKDGYILPA